MQEIVGKPIELSIADVRRLVRSMKLLALHENGSVFDAPTAPRKVIISIDYFLLIIYHRPISQVLDWADNVYNIS